MDISTYLEPIVTDYFDESQNTGRYRIGDIIHKHTDENGFPDLDQIDIAIIGVGEESRFIFVQASGSKASTPKLSFNFRMCRTQFFRNKNTMLCRID